MSAEASPQAAAPGESAASKKESQRNKRWETLVEIVEVLVLAIAAPAGPADMPQYRNPQLENAARLNATASATFEQGSIARDNAEAYLRDTVLFATVLFVVAIAQRFKVRAVRVTTTVIALALAAYTVAEMLTLPRV
jgi:hypothetical protein